MKTLRVFFDYPGFPVWTYDEKSDTINNNEFPKEFSQNHFMKYHK